MSQPKGGPSENLLELIVRYKEDLRKSDRKVAEVVLDRPAEVVEMTLATLAGGSHAKRDFRILTPSRGF